jgi:hypothetical protein
MAGSPKASVADRSYRQRDTRVGIEDGLAPPGADGPVAAETADPERRMVGLWACVCVALLCTACGGTPATAPTSRLANDYIIEILDIVQYNSNNRDRINWTDVRELVTRRAQGAQTIGDLYPSISLALGLLDDHHSWYLAASGTPVSNPSAPQCSAVSVAPPAIPADIGYVRIAGFSSPAPGADVAFAEAIQDQIRSRDAPELSGWIMDVRGNTGGNMWPMIAGVGPVLGEGLAGCFVYPHGAASTPWGYQNGGASFGATEVIRTSTPYTLIAQAPKVAVLTDNVTASSGEAVVVAFRARPNTRSFGGATCGQSTVNSTFRLSDGATLYLTIGVMADRALTSYGQSLLPDEPVLGVAEVVQSAIAWLRSSAY